MSSRAVIERAKAALLARGAVSNEEAFRTLVIAAELEHRKVRAVAEEIVRRYGPDPRR